MLVPCWRCAIVLQRARIKQVMQICKFSFTFQKHEHTVAYFCHLHASYFSTDYVNMQDKYVNMQDNLHVGDINMPPYYHSYIIQIHLQQQSMVFVHHMKMHTLHCWVRKWTC